MINKTTNFDLLAIFKKSGSDIEMAEREFVEKLAHYMKTDRSINMVEKCQKFNITPQIYYRLCQKHGIDGRLGSRLGKHNQEQFRHIFKDFEKQQANQSD